MAGTDLGDSVDDVAVLFHAELLGSKEDGGPRSDRVRILLGSFRWRHGSGLVAWAGGTATRRRAHGLGIRRAVFPSRVDRPPMAAPDRRIAPSRCCDLSSDNGSDLGGTFPQVVEHTNDRHAPRRSNALLRNRAAP